MNLFGHFQTGVIFAGRLVITLIKERCFRLIFTITKFSNGMDLNFEIVSFGISDTDFMLQIVLAVVMKQFFGLAKQMIIFSILIMFVFLQNIPAKDISRGQRRDSFLEIH